MMLMETLERQCTNIDSDTGEFEQGVV